MSTIKDRVGQRYGALVVTARFGTYAPNGEATWTCMCACGVEVIVRSGHLALGYVKSCGDRVTHPQAKRNTAREYNWTHQRIGKILGPARRHQCFTWDCDLQAAQWAYDHLDDDASLTPDGHPYSQDPQHYIPLCVSHHQQMDHAKRVSA